MFWLNGPLIIALNNRDYDFCHNRNSPTLNVISPGRNLPECDFDSQVSPRMQLGTKLVLLSRPGNPEPQQHFFTVYSFAIFCTFKCAHIFSKGAFVFLISYIVYIDY